MENARLVSSPEILNLTPTPPIETSLYRDLAFGTPVWLGGSHPGNSSDLSHPKSHGTQAGALADPGVGTRSAIELPGMSRTYRLLINLGAAQNLDNSSDVQVICIPR